MIDPAIELQLTNGGIALISEADYLSISSFNWQKVTRKSGFYVTRFHKRKVIYLHRFILGHRPGFVTDHRNGDGLDNRRTNLRHATRQQNARNRKRQKNNTSGTPGVSFRKSDQRWVAGVKIYGVYKYLGFFESREDAIACRHAFERAEFGEFRRA